MTMGVGLRARRPAAAAVPGSNPGTPPVGVTIRLTRGADGWTWRLPDVGGCLVWTERDDAIRDALDALTGRFTLTRPLPRWERYGPVMVRPKA